MILSSTGLPGFGLECLGLLRNHHSGKRGAASLRDFTVERRKKQMRSETFLVHLLPDRDFWVAVIEFC
jgi:hypothetical protein